MTRYWYKYDYYAYQMVELKVYNCDDNDRVVMCARIPNDDITKVFEGVVAVMGGQVRPQAPDIFIMEKGDKKPSKKHPQRTQMEYQNRNVLAFRLRVKRGFMIKEIAEYFDVCEATAGQMNVKGFRLLTRDPVVRLRFPELAQLADSMKKLRLVASR